MNAMSRSWIPRAEVLTRLGVKPQTLYAYVSRGRIAARPDPENPRCSLYAAEDVARLMDRSARLGRPAATTGSAHRGEAVMDTEISHCVGGHVFYRGQEAVALSRDATLEQTCRVLWGADEDPFVELKPRVDVNFPGGPRARGFAALARRAEEDSAAAGRSDKSLRREAASVLNELVDVVAGGGPRLHLHQRLARTWKLSEANAGLLRQALVLCADQGLDAPTLAVRVTAQTGAALGACVLSGWAALSGPRTRSAPLSKNSTEAVPPGVRATTRSSAAGASSTGATAKCSPASTISAAASISASGPCQTPTRPTAGTAGPTATRSSPMPSITPPA